MCNTIETQQPCIIQPWATRGHIKRGKKKEDHNSSVSCDKTANTHTALNETLKQHEIMTIHCYNHLKEEGIRVNMHHAFQAKPKWHMQVMQTNHHPNTQYYKCWALKLSLRALKLSINPSYEPGKCWQLPGVQRDYFKRPRLANMLLCRGRQWA